MNTILPGIECDDGNRFVEIVETLRGIAAQGYCAGRIPGDGKVVTEEPGLRIIRGKLAAAAKMTAQPA